MPRRTPLRPLAWALVLVPVALASGCRPAARTGPVRVAEPPGTSLATAASCTLFLRQLPGQLGNGVRRRPVTGDGQRTAAWGDPPVTLQCGTSPPDPFAEPLVVDGVGWVVTHVAGAQLWTSKGRLIGVAVRVPDAYTSQAEQMTPLSDVIARTVPAR